MLVGLVWFSCVLGFRVKLLTVGLVDQLSQLASNQVEMVEK